MLRTGQVVLLVVALCGAHGLLVKPIPGSKPWRPRLDGRIVGGSSVDISQYPWQLYFTIANYMCGASILSTTWALSAAHCVDGYSYDQLQLRAGTSTRGSGGTVHSVSIVGIHINYGNYDYDICVLRVSNAFSFGTNVRPVVLTLSEPSDGTSVTATGWGMTTDGGSAANTLQAVTVQIVNRNTCNDAYGNISDRMICAGVNGGGKDSCGGDSGGPLVSGSTQVGIVSFGYGCAVAGYPGVYTNVANLRSWIKDTSGV